MSRDENRTWFPTVAKVVDEFRAVFGDGVRLTYASENGIEVGNALDESQYRVICGADMVVTKKTEEVEDDSASTILLRPRKSRGAQPAR